MSPPERAFMANRPMFSRWQVAITERSRSVHSGERGYWMVSYSPLSAAARAISALWLVSPMWRIMPCLLYTSAVLSTHLAAQELSDIVFTDNLPQRFEDPDICYACLLYTSRCV